MQENFAEEETDSKILSEADLVGDENLPIVTTNDETEKHPSSPVEVHLSSSIQQHPSSPFTTASLSNDVGSWRQLGPKDRDVIAIMGPQTNPSELPRDTKGRAFPLSIFIKSLPNGESTKRDWLVWSKSAAGLFCFSCCLFNVKPPSPSCSAFSHPEVGFKDNWKKLYEKVKSHELSAVHVSNYRKWKDLLNSLEKHSGVDAMHQQNLIQETNRWRQILGCLHDVTLFSGERNLPFRGSSLAIGDPDNGLFLGTLELLMI